MNSAAELQLAGGVVRPGVLFRMDTDPPIRLWFGVGPLDISADLIEPAPATYSGAGELLGLPVVQALINGVAERVEFTLSGAVVDSAAMRLADAEAALVRGARVNIGLVAFDVNWQRTSDSVKWLWEGEADTPRVSRITDAGGAVTRAVAISVGSLMTDRKRPGLSYLTDAEQRRRSPDDRACSRTPLYSMAVNKAWPRF